MIVGRWAVGHYAAVSIIIEYFAADDDAAAAAVLDGGPGDDFETMSCGNFLADFATAEWESVLLGRTVAEHEDADPSRVVIDDGPESYRRVFALSPELQAALAGARPDRLAGVAERWVDEYGGDGVRADTACEILRELSDLARSASSRGQSLYCWMC